MLPNRNAPLVWDRQFSDAKTVNSHLLNFDVRIGKFTNSIDAPTDVGLSVLSFPLVDGMNRQYMAEYFRTNDFEFTQEAEQYGENRTSHFRYSRQESDAETGLRLDNSTQQSHINVERRHWPLLSCNASLSQPILFVKLMMR